jgi:hypothetical protein
MRLCPIERGTNCRLYVPEHRSSRGTMFILRRAQRRYSYRAPTENVLRRLAPDNLHPPHADVLATRWTCIVPSCVSRRTRRLGHVLCHSPVAAVPASAHPCSAPSRASAAATSAASREKRRRVYSPGTICCRVCRRHGLPRGRSFSDLRGLFDEGDRSPEESRRTVGVRAGVCVETRGDLKSHSSDCAATFSAVSGACEW